MQTKKYGIQLLKLIKKNDGTFLGQFKKKYKYLNKFGKQFSAPITPSNEYALKDALKNLCWRWNHLWCMKFRGGVRVVMKWSAKPFTRVQFSPTSPMSIQSIILGETIL